MEGTSIYIKEANKKNIKTGKNIYTETRNNISNSNIITYSYNSFMLTTNLYE